MAANKFATMLHRNTNKITLILIYAILEWILIILLLFNSLFSYLIIKFADFFGLKRPCLWCSRLDHLFEPSKTKDSYRDLVCEVHASEISKLGYCPNHRKLAESEFLCEDCSSSSRPGCCELSKEIAFFPWVKKIGMIEEDGETVIENREVNLRCSCCGVSLDKNFCSPYLLIKPSWKVLEYAPEGNLISEAGVDDEVDDGDHSDQSRSEFVNDRCEDGQGIGESRGIQMVSEVDGGFGKREEEAGENWSCFVSNIGFKDMLANEDHMMDVVMEKEQEQEPVKEDHLDAFKDDKSCDQAAVIQVGSVKDASPEFLPQHLEFLIDVNDYQLIPVEFIDSTSEIQIQHRHKVEDERNCANEDVILDFDMQVETQVIPIVENRCTSGEMVALLSDYEREEEPKVSVPDSMELVENESTPVSHAGKGDLTEGGCRQASVAQATQTPSNDAGDGDDVQPSAATAGEMDSDDHPATEEVSQMQSDEIDAEVSIGTEIPDQESNDEVQSQEILPSYPHIQDPSTSSAKLHADDDHGFEQAEEETAEFKTISVETSEPEINNKLSFCSELNEIEEDKVPDTPTHLESLHQLHKRLLLFERKDSGTEESLDGSVISDIEAGDGILTTDKLRSALRAERKALNALYAELEEERSASAVAANQTMAMINRLQEEKAAMQMEGLQYQRMMEEQSEYDQEALQLLNDLMVKREKEKQELEKELEIYRKKVQDYEVKEKMMLLRLRKDDITRSITSSASCSNADDSDGLSIDLNHEAKEESNFYSHQESSNHNTPTDAVLYLEERLANFEEERLSILEQLKALEEKLFTLSDDEEQHFEDVKSLEHFYGENCNGYDDNFELRNEENGFENGHSKEMNGRHHQERRLMGSKAKRLLPLFNATDAEGETGVLNGNGHEFDYVPSQNASVTKFELENKKVVIEEEVDHVYKRLQKLEADREFLKHCISSLRKGDKGIDLLQEILQHLRDLRSVELRVRNMSDGPL